MRKHCITLSDLAKELNISPSTVSRALNNHPAINEKTKTSVIELASRLNYQPNLLALNLLQKRTNTIGIIIPDITSYFYSLVITGIQDFLYPLDYNLILGQSNESYEEELKIIDTFASIRVDGILIASASQSKNSEHLKKVIRMQIPLVLFDRDYEDIDADKVFVNEYSGAFQAVDYLVKSGCKRIAHIAGASNISTSKHRKQGYLDALEKNDLPILQELMIESEGFNPEDGANAMKQLLKKEKLPDAVFAFSDSIAIGAMYVILENGIKLPQQISVVGFDDILYSAYFRPSLTTIMQPAYEMGILSTRILLKRINERKDDFKARVETLFPELVIRESSNPIQ